MVKHSNIQNRLGLLIGLVICLFLFATNSCSKDYSYEYQPKDSTLVQIPVAARPLIPACLSCVGLTTQPDSSWRFLVDGSQLCGRTGRAVINFERTGFTFFGPSDCSIDSGFVATVYLNASDVLNQNKTNIRAGYFSLYYYDRVKPSNVLSSHRDDPPALVIDNYDHQTGITTGQFYGAVFTEAGERKEIVAGKFRIRF